MVQAQLWQRGPSCQQRPEAATLSTWAPAVTIISHQQLSSAFSDLPARAACRHWQLRIDRKGTALLRLKRRPRPFWLLTL